MTVILDCNIWITLALNRQLSFIDNLHNEGITIIGCEELFKELQDVASRAKFEKYFSKQYIEDFLNLYNITTIPFKIGWIEQIVSDQKDNYLFALCDATKADYPVTGDKLLLKVTKHKVSEVMTLAKFRQIVSNS